MISENEFLIKFASEIDYEVVHQLDKHKLPYSIDLISKNQSATILVEELRKSPYSSYKFSKECENLFKNNVLELVAKDILDKLGHFIGIEEANFQARELCKEMSSKINWEELPTIQKVIKNFASKIICNLELMRHTNNEIEKIFENFRSKYYFEVKEGYNETF